MAPAAPGYSSTIRRESRDAYRYPDGPVWTASGNGINNRPMASTLTPRNFLSFDFGDRRARSGALGARPPRRDGLPVRGDAVVGRCGGHGGGAGGARRSGRPRVAADRLPRQQRRRRTSTAGRRAEDVTVSATLFALLQRSAELHAATGGAFDVTSTPLSRCWGLLQREGRAAGARRDRRRARSGRHAARAPRRADARRAVRARRAWS